MNPSNLTPQFQLSKYFKPFFLPNLILINSLCLLYYIFPFSIEYYLGTVSIVLLLFKFIHGYQYSSLKMIYQNNCALMLMEKLNIEFIKLNWLINKFNKQCLQWAIVTCLAFYAIDQLIAPSLSVWVLINLGNLYVSFTKYMRNLVKYRLGLYKEYNKYVIKISEPTIQEF